MDAPLRLAWEVTPASYVFAPPVAGQTTVLALGQDAIYGLWASTGALRWRFPEGDTRDVWRWAIRTRAGAVCGGRFGGRMGVVGLGFDGAPRWRVPIEGKGAVAVPARDGDGLWLLSPRKGRSTLLRRIRSDGATLAKWDTIDAAHGLVEVEGALLFTGTRGGQPGLYRLELASGELRPLWRGAVIGVNVGEGALLVETYEDPFGEVLRIDAKGAVVWRARASLGDVHRGCALVTEPCEGGEREACLDLHTGAARWRTAARDPDEGAVTIVGVGDVACVSAASLDALDLRDGSHRQRLSEPDGKTRYLGRESVWRDRLVVARAERISCWAHPT